VRLFRLTHSDDDGPEKNTPKNHLFCHRTAKCRPPRTDML
jgi:hypothetical protein